MSGADCSLCGYRFFQQAPRKRSVVKRQISCEGLLTNCYKLITSSQTPDCITVPRSFPQHRRWASGKGSKQIHKIKQNHLFFVFLTFTPSKPDAGRGIPAVYLRRAPNRSRVLTRTSGRNIQATQVQQGQHHLL